MACTQGLDRPRLVGAFAHYSPWVMPGVLAFGALAFYRTRTQ